MRSIARVLLGLLLLSSLVLGPNAVWSGQAPPWRPKPKNKDAVKVLIVTGGHDYDASFDSVFEGYDEMAALVNPHPNAFQSDLRRRVDVLVLYDMVPSMEPKKQQNLQAFAESGKGIVVIHHAIVAHADWPWWSEELVGGRYFQQAAPGRPASTYKHDEDMLVRPVGEHPITKGVKPFRIWDETYKGVWISPKVQVILQTDNPTSDGPVAWISPYEKSRVVYLQLGHGRDAHLNPIYRQLVRNAILWAAGRLN